MATCPGCHVRSLRTSSRLAEFLAQGCLKLSLESDSSENQKSREAENDDVFAIASQIAVARTLLALAASRNHQKPSTSERRSQRITTGATIAMIRLDTSCSEASQSKLSQQSSEIFAAQSATACGLCSNEFNNARRSRVVRSNSSRNVRIQRQQTQRSVANSRCVCTETDGSMRTRIAIRIRTER